MPRIILIIFHGSFTNPARSFHRNRALKGTNKSQKAANEKALPIKATNKHSPAEGTGEWKGEVVRRQI